MSDKGHIARIKGNADFSTELDRFEAKYIIPRQLVEPIKDFIKPYCELDKHCAAAGGKYYINTVQYDSPSLSLHYAKEREDDWKPGVLRQHVDALNLKSVKEREAFREFVRLHNEIGAEPRVLVRYCREAYTGIFDHYARVTFDTQLCYQPIRHEFDWGRNGRFISMDSGMVRRRKDSPLVLEIKCTEQVPAWMIELVQQFDLIRCGNCKYSTAIWMEKLFIGMGDAPFADELIID